MADTHETRQEKLPSIGEIEWISAALLDRTDERNQPAIRALYYRYWDLVSTAPGSSHNHQAWPGGYLEHIRQVNHYVAYLYSLWVDLGVFASLPEEERFTLEEALTVMSLHDIEKPFKTILGPDGSPIINPDLLTKQQRDDLSGRFLKNMGSS